MDKIYDLTSRPNSPKIARLRAYPIHFGSDGSLHTSDSLVSTEFGPGGYRIDHVARYAIILDELDNLYTYMILGRDFRWWDVHRTPITYDLYRPSKFQPSIQEVGEIFEKLKAVYAIRRL